MSVEPIPGVRVRFFGREYDVALAGRDSLMLVNRKTAFVLPATTVDGPRERPYPLAVDVYDVDGIVDVLAAAGVLRRIGEGEPSIGLRVACCAIAHPDLIDMIGRARERYVDAVRPRGDGRER